ncbi:unnamed protein product [Closterium sp. Yama58-4]|nr:unnamed protein product [Closterium sp. Yama58-4]
MFLVLAIPANPATSSSDSRFGSSTSNDSTASSSSSSSSGSGGSGGSSSTSSPGRADDDVSSGRGENALGPEFADGGGAQSTESAGGGSAEERLRGRASAQRMWFGARAARGARRVARRAEGAEGEAQGRSRSRTRGGVRRAAAESANAHEGDDEGERGNGRVNGGAEQGASECNDQRPLSVVIHGPGSSFFVGTQVVYNGDGGQGRDASNRERSKSRSPVKELKEKHKIDADTGAFNGDAGASPECIILEKSCSVSCHAEAHNGAAINAYYDPVEGSHAMGGEESDGSCSSYCSSYCSDDSSCSNEGGKGDGLREKRTGGGGGDGGEFIDFHFVSASGESEGSTWIEAVHLVLPPVIPRSSSQATLDALQAPNGTAGMEPILDAKWEARFKRTKRVFTCLLLLGCLLYIAAFLSGIIVNSTTGAPAAANTTNGNPAAAALPSHASSSGGSGSSISSSFGGVAGTSFGSDYSPDIPPTDHTYVTSSTSGSTSGTSSSTSSTSSSSSSGSSSSSSSSVGGGAGSFDGDYHPDMSLNGYSYLADSSTTSSTTRNTSSSNGGSPSSNIPSNNTTTGDGSTGSGGDGGSSGSGGGDGGSSRDNVPIAALLDGMAASMLTSQTLWVAMSYLILYLVIASLGLAGAHYNNVSMMTLYIFIQTTVTIISVLDSIRPFLLFCILLIILAIHIRFHMLSMELAERRLLARLVGRSAPPPRTDTWPHRLRMFPGSFSDMLRHTPVSRFRLSGDPWYQEIVVRYRARRAEEEREGVRERNERGRRGEEEGGVSPGRKDVSRTSRELSDGGGAGGPFNVFPAQSYLNVFNFNIPLPRLPQLPFPFKDKLKDKFNKFHKSPPPSPPPPSPPPPSPSPPPPSPPPPKKKSPPPPKKSPPPPEKKSPPPPVHKSPPPPEKKSPPPPEHKSPPPPKHKSPPPPEHKSPPPPEKKSPPPPPPKHKSPPPPEHKSPPPPEKKSPPPPEHKSPPPPKHKSPPPPEKKSPPPPEHKSPPPPEKKSPPPPEKKSPPPPEKKSPPPPSPSPPPPPPPPRKPSKKDHLLIILLKGAAVLVRKAHAILPPGNDSQKEDLWDVVKALSDAEVLINEGRRELVREQLDNSVVTLEEVGGKLQGGWVQDQAAGGLIGLARVEIMKAQALFQE